MNIIDIETLVYNPFFMSKIILNFLKGYGKENNCPIQLMFYVLPLVYNKESRERLNIAKSSSTLNSLFNKKEITRYSFEDNKLSAQIRLTNLKVDYDVFKKHTKDVLIILYNEEKIEFQNTITLSNKIKESDYIYKKENNEVKRELLKAGYYLGVVFAKDNISLINDYLGVKNE